MVNVSNPYEIKFFNDYDVIVIGTPIHIGKIHKNVKKFLQKYEKELQTKKIYFFYCGLSEEHLADIEEQFPESLRSKLLFKSFFGGEIMKSKLRGIEKMGIEMIEKQAKADYTNFNTIDNAKIEEFIRHITGA
jgi:menaquinone-dependent protoporphyrinogen oxidase